MKEWDVFFYKAGHLFVTDCLAACPLYNHPAEVVCGIIYTAYAETVAGVQIITFALVTIPQPDKHTYAEQKHNQHERTDYLQRGVPACNF